MDMCRVAVFGEGCADLYRDRGWVDGAMVAVTSGTRACVAR
jgi:hypothetical protein